MGTLLEPLVIDMYEERTKSVVERKDFAQHPEMTWMRGELDAYKPGVVIDAKTTATKTYEKSWANGAIPNSIVYQQRYYAFLADAGVMDIPVLLRDTGHFEIRTLERDAREEVRIVSAAIEFWEEVLAVRKELANEEVEVAVGAGGAVVGASPG